MTIEKQIAAVRVLPYRYLLIAVIKTLEGTDIIDAIDFAIEEYIHDMEAGYE